MSNDVANKKLCTYFATVNDDNVLNWAVITAFRNILWSLSENRMERILNELTNFVDDTHALEHFSEHNLKRMSIREEEFERLIKERTCFPSSQPVMTVVMNWSGCHILWMAGMYVINLQTENLR